MISIVTKTGDDGTTGLFGGERTSKASDRLHAYGTVDELNAVIGVVLSETYIQPQLIEQLLRTQRVLFQVGADLASPNPEQKHRRIQRIEQTNIDELERWIEKLEPTLPPLTHFILPSGSRAGALLHQARTVCRRAERWVCGLEQKEPINPLVRIYLNRLSDYLFLAAREANRQAGAKEEQV